MQRRNQAPFGLAQDTRSGVTLTMTAPVHARSAERAYCSTKSPPPLAELRHEAGLTDAMQKACPNGDARIVVEATIPVNVNRGRLSSPLPHRQ